MAGPVDSLWRDIRCKSPAYPGYIGTSDNPNSRKSDHLRTPLNLGIYLTRLSSSNTLAANESAGGTGRDVLGSLSTFESGENSSMSIQSIFTFQKVLKTSDIYPPMMTCFPCLRITSEGFAAEPPCSITSPISDSAMMKGPKILSTDLR